MRPDRSGSKRGFTLLEALVATAVVAFLLLPMLQSIVTSKSVSKAASRQLSAHLESCPRPWFCLDCNSSRSHSL